MRRHVQKVLGGEYDIPYRHSAPVILDIGANVGSFAAWALKRWPGAHVHCYEPLPDNFALLKRNLGQFEGRSVSLHNFAVGDPSLTRLYLGRNNCGEASFYDIGEQTTDTVEVETRRTERPAQGADREDRHRRLRGRYSRRHDVARFRRDHARISFRGEPPKDRRAVAGLRARRRPNPGPPPRNAEIFARTRHQVRWHAHPKGCRRDLSSASGQESRTSANRCAAPRLDLANPNPYMP